MHLVCVAFEVSAGYLYKYPERGEMISELSAHGGQAESTEQWFLTGCVCMGRGRLVWLTYH